MGEQVRVLKLLPAIQSPIDFQMGDMEERYVQTETAAVTPSTKMLWMGGIMSAIPVLLVLLGSVMKLLKLPAVHEGFAKAGLSEQLIVPVGLIELTCVVVYLIPRTDGAGSDPHDWLVGRRDDYDFADWGSDLPHAGYSWDAGLGRPVLAGRAAAGAHPTSQGVADRRANDDTLSKPDSWTGEAPVATRVILAAADA